MKCFVCDEEVMGDERELLEHVYYQHFPPGLHGRCWCGHSPKLLTGSLWTFKTYISHTTGRLFNKDECQWHINALVEHYHNALNGVKDDAVSGV